VTADPRSDSPLAGICILSLAEQYPGPFATMLLADLGADVVLVERPAGGDPTRRFSGHFEGLNRNKRSIALDLKSTEGRQVFWKLAARADVIVEGYKPGVVDRLGIGAKEVQAQLPGIIYASISSFGQTGPLGDRGGHDISVQGLAGLVTGDDPAPAPLPLADLASGMFAALGIVSALVGRERHQLSSYIDVSMLDALVSWRSTALTSSLNGLDPAPYPPVDPGYGVFTTGSGQLVTLSIAGEDHQWRALCEALGLSDLAPLTTIQRESRAVEITARLQSCFRDSDWPDVERRLVEGGVGFGPVHDDRAVAVDPQVVARGMIVDLPDQPGTRVVRQPLLFDGTASPIRCRAPRLGEHTQALLEELGYPNDSIRDLAASGAVALDLGA
jgi:crotonobetainyl-CoA:carnitine CoA-transferase CaiB-like acyl-CoA transferase